MSQQAGLPIPEKLVFEYDCAALQRAFRAARLTGDLTSIDVGISSDGLSLSTRKPAIRSRSSVSVRWLTPPPERMLAFTTNRRIFQILREAPGAQATVTIIGPDPEDNLSESGEWSWRFSLKKDGDTASKEIEWPFERVESELPAPIQAEGRAISNPHLKDVVRLLHKFGGVDRLQASPARIQIGDAAGLVQARVRARLVRNSALDTPSFCCTSAQASDLSAALEEFSETKFHSGDDWIAFSDNSSLCILTGGQKPRPIDESQLPVFSAQVKASTSELAEAIVRITSQTAGPGDVVRIDTSDEYGGSLRLSCAVPSNHERGGEAVVTVPLPLQEEGHITKAAITLGIDSLTRLSALPRAKEIVLAFDEKAICATQELDGLIIKSWLSASRAKR